MWGGWGWRGRVLDIKGRGVRVIRRILRRCQKRLEARLCEIRQGFWRSVFSFFLWGLGMGGSFGSWAFALVSVSDFVDVCVWVFTCCLLGWNSRNGTFLLFSLPFCWYGWYSVTCSCCFFVDDILVFSFPSSLKFSYVFL